MFDIPNSLLLSAGKQSVYQDQTYAEYLDLWHNMTVPAGIALEIKRVRLNIDLTQGCDEANFNSPIMTYWSEDSDLGSAAPGGTYPSCGTDLDSHDLRYVRFTKGNLSEVNKKILLFFGGTHGGHESSSQECLQNFAQLLLEAFDAGDPWADQVLSKFQILIFPCVNVYGNFSTAKEPACLGNSYNGKHSILLWHKDEDGDPAWPEFYVGENPPVEQADYYTAVPNGVNLIYNYAFYPSSDWTTSVNAYTPKIGFDDRVPARFQSGVMVPFTEPECMVIRNVVNTFLSQGFRFSLQCDWHNNGLYATYIVPIIRDINGIATKLYQSFETYWVENYQNKCRELLSYSNTPSDASYKLYRKLATAILITDVAPFTITVNSPSDTLPFVMEASELKTVIVIGNERFLCTNIPNRATYSTIEIIERGYQGSTVEAHSINSDVYPVYFKFEVTLSSNASRITHFYFNQLLGCNTFSPECPVYWRQMLTLSSQYNTEVFFSTFNIAMAMFINFYLQSNPVNDSEAGNGLFNDFLYL